MTNRKKIIKLLKKNNIFKAAVPGKLKFKYTPNYKPKLIYLLIFLVNNYIRKLITNYYLLSSRFALFSYARSFLYLRKNILKKKRYNYAFLAKKRNLAAPRRHLSRNLNKHKSLLKFNFTLNKYSVAYASPYYVKKIRTLFRLALLRKIRRQLVALRPIIKLQMRIISFYKQIRRLTSKLFVAFYRMMQVNFYNQNRHDITATLLKKGSQNISTFAGVTSLDFNCDPENSNFFYLNSKSNKFYLHYLQVLNATYLNYGTNTKFDKLRRFECAMLLGKKKKLVHLFLYYFSRFPSFVKHFYPLNYVSTYRKERASIDFYLSKNSFKDLFIFTEFNFYNSLHKYKRIPQRLRD